MNKLMLIAVTLGAVVAAGATQAASRHTAEGHNAPMMTPVYDWNGIYVGVNAGGAFGRASVNPMVTSEACDNPPGCVPILALLSAGQSMSPSGFTGGVQVGVNRQFHNVLVGFETDLDYFGMRGSFAYGPTRPSAFPITGTGAGSVTTNWLVTFRPRAGLVVDRLLAYVTGGLALTDQSNTEMSQVVVFGQTNGPIGTFNLSSTSNIGSVVGAGLEFAWSDQVSVKAEYLHLDFTRTSALAPVAGGIGGFDGATMSSSWHLTADVVRAGINHKLP
jgi:outer membrane immunogenic protein